MSNSCTSVSLNEFFSKGIFVNIKKVNDKRARGALTYESDVRVPPSTSDVGVFRWQNCVKKGGLSVTKCTKIGESFSEMHQKIGQKISQHFVKMSKFSKNPIFLPKIVTCVTIKCENEGSLSNKDVPGSFGDKEFVKIGGHWVKVGKNGGLSVKVSEKVGSFWWHMARNPKLSAPPPLWEFHSSSF